MTQGGSEQPHVGYRVEVNEGDLGVLQQFVANFSKTFRDEIEESMKQVAPEATTYAKTNPKAHWIDRTGLARETLKAKPEGTSLHISGDVEENKWLEIRRDFHGRYATMEATAEWALHEVTSKILPRRIARLFGRRIRRKGKS